MLLQKKVEIGGLQTTGNALKLSILPSPRHFCIILNIYDPIRRTFLAPGGWVRTPRTPCLRACYYISVSVSQKSFNAVFIIFNN